MKDLRFGVVGMGNRGCNGWLPTFKAVKGAKVVAVCDKIQALVDQGLKTYGDPDTQGYTDYDKMLKDAPLDAVAVVVEPENNPTLAVRALEAGKHTICDVPLAFSIEECWKVVTAVEKSGLTFAMGEQMSYSPMTLAWKKLVDEGRLGKVLLAEGQYLHGMGEDRLWHDKATGRRVGREEAKKNPDKVYKSRIWNNRHAIWYLPHEFGPFLRILDDRVQTVSCFATRPQSYNWEEVPISDLEVAIMKTQKDTLIRQANGFMFPTATPFHWYHLLGTGGEMETSRIDNGKLFSGHWWQANSYMHTRQPMEWSWTHTQPGDPAAGASGHGGLDYYPIRDFVDAIVEDRSPVVHVYRAADISAAGICAGISAEQNGQTVEVPDFRPGPHRKTGQWP